MTCQVMWVARDRRIWFAERRVIGSQSPGICFWLLFFVGIEKTVWRNNLESLPQFIINPTPKVKQELPCWKNYEEEEGVKRDKKNIGVGTSVTVKVGEINENIREGKTIRMRKELFVLYYLAHIFFFPRTFLLLVLSACLIHGVQMFNSCKGLLRNSHTRIENFVPLIRLSTL